jgi:hypothetical protein
MQVPHIDNIPKEVHITSFIVLKIFSPHQRGHLERALSSPSPNLRYIHVLSASSEEYLHHGSYGQLYQRHVVCDGDEIRHDQADWYVP